MNRKYKYVQRRKKNYKENIFNVHLSARDDSNKHLPIDNFYKEVVSYLIKSNWKGNVILEYLFEFHNRLISDLELLKKMQ